MKSIRLGEAFLWLDLVVAVDIAAGSPADTWTLPLEQYLSMGSANQATFSVDAFAIGPGAGTTTLYIDRSSGGDPDTDLFDTTAPAATQLLSRARSYYTFSLGRDNTTGVAPRGLIRVRMKNTSIIEGAFTLVRLRIWVVLQDYPPLRPRGRGLGDGYGGPAQLPSLPEISTGADAERAVGQMAGRMNESDPSGMALWYDDVIVLDSAVGVQANSYTLPMEHALRFGNARQLMVLLEYSAVGLGGASTKIKFQRTANPTEQLIITGGASAWEDMAAFETLRGCESIDSSL